MNEIMKLVVSLTRLVDLTADLVCLRLQELGRETEPVQQQLPAADKPKRTRKPKEEVPPAESTAPTAPATPQNSNEKTVDLKAALGAKAEFFVKTMKGRGLDGMTMAKEAIKRQGVIALKDVPLEKIPALIADFDRMVQESGAKTEPKKEEVEL